MFGYEEMEGKEGRESISLIRIKLGEWREMEGRELEGEAPSYLKQNISFHIEKI